MFHGNGGQKMRKLFGVLLIFSLALGGAFLRWPEQASIYWKRITVFAEQQIDAELATVAQIKAGKLKMGATPAKKIDGQSISHPAKLPDVAAVTRPQKAAQKITEKINTPVIITNPEQKAETPPNSAPSPAAAAAISPDAIPDPGLGIKLKHEVRENQVKEETFWTKERIKEALDNGEPKSRSSACLAFCDKNNTVTEINMPKPAPGQP